MITEVIAANIRIIIYKRSKILQFLEIEVNNRF